MEYIRRLVAHYTGDQQLPPPQPDLRQDVFPRQPNTSPVGTRASTPPQVFLTPPLIKKLQWDTPLEKPSRDYQERRERRYSAPSAYAPRPQRQQQLGPPEFDLSRLQSSHRREHGHREGEHRHNSIARSGDYYKSSGYQTSGEDHRVKPQYEIADVIYHKSQESRPKPRPGYVYKLVEMPVESFQGPVCKDLVEFMKSVKDIPSKHKTTFDALSAKTIDAICDIDALHVWESGDDIEDLLQLTQVIVKLRVEAEKQEDRKKKEPAMVIISSEKASAQQGRDGFSRICDLIQHLADSDGKPHLDGKIRAFGAIVVVRGIAYTSSRDEAEAVKRINVAIERTFKMQRPVVKQLVWHHGPTLSLLLSWIDATTNELRSSLTVISVTAALDITDGVKPSPRGKANTPKDLDKLGDYARRLGVPVVFVDPASQLITFEYLATYMYYWAFYIHTFLPPSILRPHFYAALDAIVTHAFRLRGASESRYGVDVVRKVQDHLTASTARAWAKSCIDPASYTKELCRSAGTEAALHQAVQLADCPFALLSNTPGYAIPAFSRLSLCPTEKPADTTGTVYLAAPVAFSFSSTSFRATSTPPFHILLPRENQHLDSITMYIQGTLMGVLARIRRDKGLSDEPSGGAKPSATEKELWSEVVKACCWAVDGCKGKMPEGVEEKVGFVREKFVEGTFSYATGLAKPKVKPEVKQQGGSGWGQQAAGMYGQGQGQGQAAQSGGWGSGQGWGQAEQGRHNANGWSSGAATVGSTWN